MAQTEEGFAVPQLSIDALNPAGTKAWRLGADLGWHKTKFAGPLRESDFATRDPDEARSWLAGRVHKDWRGRITWESAPGRSTFAPGEISLHAIAHRHEVPPLPEREDLGQVVASAEEKTRRVICLDLQGRFLLRDPAQRSVSSDPALAAHSDSLMGDRFLGPEAAKDEDYLNALYGNFLGAWYQHLRSGRVSVYAGEPLWGLSIAELRERIRTWTPG